MLIHHAAQVCKAAAGHSLGESDGCEDCCVVHDELVGCAQFLGMLALSSEFENIAVREEELPELDALSRSACPVDIKGGAENKHGKVNVLLQVRKPDLDPHVSWTAPSMPSLPWMSVACTLLPAGVHDCVHPPFPLEASAGGTGAWWQGCLGCIVCLPYRSWVSPVLFFWG